VLGTKVTSVRQTVCVQEKKYGACTCNGKFTIETMNLLNGKLMHGMKPCRETANRRIADREVQLLERPLRPIKRLTTEALDGCLGISYLPFEPDDFSQSPCPHLPSAEVGFDAVNDRCRSCIRAAGPYGIVGADNTLASRQPSH